MGNALGCGKKEQAATASPTPATHLTTPEPPQAPSEQGDRLQRFLRTDEGEKYLSPEEVANRKATPEGRNMLKSQLLSGKYITRPMLVKRGVRHLRRTKRARDRAAKNKTRKARNRRGGRHTARHRPAKRRTRTRRQRRNKRKRRRRR